MHPIEDEIKLGHLIGLSNKKPVFAQLRISALREQVSCVTPDVIELDMGAPTSWDTSELTTAPTTLTMPCKGM